MNSRRLMGLPLLLRFRRAEAITFGRMTPPVHHSKFGGQCLRWVIPVGHDRGDTAGCVRFAPKADKLADVSLCPLSAITGCERSQRNGSGYSITLSASC
jgi:hypothetical protein